MEADWDIDIGPDAPAIEIPWEGFIDLRSRPLSAVDEIQEAATNPSLREALIKLNANESGLFSSKCDVWWLDPEEIDKDEFGSQPENTRHAFASYIDVLFSDEGKFQSFTFHESAVRRLTGELKATTLPDCRVDLVVRSATVETLSGCGITLYAAGCGSDTLAAQVSWQRVLQTAVNATILLSLSSGAGE